MAYEPEKEKLDDFINIIGKPDEEYILRGKLKALYVRSGYQCAFKDCEELLMIEETDISRVCHIREVDPTSYRYDPNLDESEYNDVSNLILLCLKHHMQVDYERCSVERLRQMKEISEGRVYGYLNSADGRLFDKKIDEIFEKYDFEKMLARRTIARICQETKSTFLMKFCSKLQDVRDDISRLLKDDCALDMPEGIQYKFTVFLMMITLLEKRLHSYNKGLCIDDTESLSKNISERLDTIQQIVDDIDKEYNVLCRLRYIGWG